MPDILKRMGALEIFAPEAPFDMRVGVLRRLLILMDGHRFGTLQVWRSDEQASREELEHAPKKILAEPHDNHLVAFLDTPRALKHVGRQVWAAWGHLGGEVHPWDLVVLTLIRHEWPAFFRRLDLCYSRVIAEIQKLRGREIPDDVLKTVDENGNEKASPSISIAGIPEGNGPYWPIHLFGLLELLLPGRVCPPRRMSLPSSEGFSSRTEPESTAEEYAAAELIPAYLLLSLALRAFKDSEGEDVLIFQPASQSIFADEKYWRRIRDGVPFATPEEISDQVVLRDYANWSASVHNAEPWDSLPDAARLFVQGIAGPPPQSATRSSGELKTAPDPSYCRVFVTLAGGSRDNPIAGSIPFNVTGDTSDVPLQSIAERLTKERFFLLMKMVAAHLVHRGGAESGFGVYTLRDVSDVDGFLKHVWMNDLKTNPRDSWHHLLGLLRCPLDLNVEIEEYQEVIQDIVRTVAETSISLALLILDHWAAHRPEEPVLRIPESWIRGQKEWLCKDLLKREWRGMVRTLGTTNYDILNRIFHFIDEGLLGCARFDGHSKCLIGSFTIEHDRSGSWRRQRTAEVGGGTMTS